MIWFRFRLLRRYLALWPSQVGRAHRLLAMVGEGGPGHGPVHFLPAGAAEIGFRWDPPVALCSISRQLFLMLGVIRLPLIFAVGKVFGVVRCWMCMALCSSFTLLMSGKIGLCFEVLWLVVFGMVSCWTGFGVSLCLASSAVPLMVMVIFLGECTFPPLVEIRENPECHDLMRMDKAHWPRCLLWHGWLPTLSGVNGASSCAADASESALYQVEVALGRNSSGLLAEWSLPDGFDSDEVASRMPEAPDVWSDGSLVSDSVTGVSAAGYCRSGVVDTGTHFDRCHLRERGRHLALSYPSQVSSVLLNKPLLSQLRSTCTHPFCGQVSPS